MIRILIKYHRSFSTVLLHSVAVPPTTKENLQQSPSFSTNIETKSSTFLPLKYLNSSKEFLTSGYSENSEQELIQNFNQIISNCNHEELLHYSTWFSSKVVFYRSYEEFGKILYSRLLELIEKNDLSVQNI